MQAIILAAGMGKRLGKLTEHSTKCMVKVNGVALIDRMLNQLTALPLNRIIIVIGYKGDSLKNYLGDSFNTIPLVYIENPIYASTNNIYSLYLTKDYFIEDETLLMESDIIIEKTILEKIISNTYPNLAVVAKYQNWMNGTMVVVGDNNYITNYISSSDFSCTDIHLYYKTVNIYKFNKDFIENRYIPFLEAYIKSFGNNEYYEQVLSVLSVSGKTDLKALPILTEKWYEIDDEVDLHNAETLFSEDTSTAKYLQYYGGYWRFPELIDFCYLVNPFFPTEKIQSLLKHHFEELLCQYPSGMNTNILSVANYFNIQKENICVGNGAAELIKCLMRIISGNTGVIFPTFEEYPNCIDTEKIIPYYINNDDFSYNATDIKSFYEYKDISNLIVINPDNPSGSCIAKTDLSDLLEWAKLRGINLIIDESFIDFSTDFENNTLLEDRTLTTYPNLIIIKSISKSYGVPGLRLGILASSNKKLINSIKKELPIWNINSFAEFFMQILKQYKEDYSAACKAFINERERFYKELCKVEFLRVIPSQANYFLCEVVEYFKAGKLAEILLRRYNILIKDCSQKKGFEEKNFIRLAIRNKEDNDKLINALKLLLKHEDKYLSSISG